MFYFTSKRTDDSYAPWIAMFGDMGSENGQSIPRLEQEVVSKTIDLVMHVGDFAYNFDEVREVFRCYVPLVNRVLVLICFFVVGGSILT